MFPANKLISRIAFLCGCAQPGRDGVGDYTALLAAECERRGRPALRIALNDPFTALPEETAGLLRLPAAMSWNECFERAYGAVERFGADAVSLQWVPYAFHARGIPWGIEKGLARVAAGRPAHVMCHEIWIGAEAGASPARRVTGMAQRAIMRRVFRALRPVVVQTSNPSYAALLRRAGVEAEVLPLFGSIPIAGIRTAGDPAVARFGMFGALHPEWPPEPLLARLRSLGRRIEIEHIGRIGGGEPIWRDMERRYGTEFAFKRHGEQPVETISRFLTATDFGIATTPLALLGKSATAAAMFEHGLPVIVNRDDVRYPGVDPGRKPEGVIELDEHFPDALREARRREPHSRLPEVADQFLGRLEGTRAQVS